MKMRFDTSRLKPGIWFVRSGKGGGVLPVTVEGRRVTRLFVLGMLGSGLLGPLLAWALNSYFWLAIVPLGMAASAWWFIKTAMKHADRSINYTDLLVKE